MRDRLWRRDALRLWAMPLINLTDEELAAVTAALRRLIEEDRFPRAPRLDLLRSALARQILQRRRYNGR